MYICFFLSPAPSTTDHTAMEDVAFPNTSTNLHPLWNLCRLAREVVKTARNRKEQNPCHQTKPRQEAAISDRSSSSKGSAELSGIFIVKVFSSWVKLLMRKFWEFFSPPPPPWDFSSPCFTESCWAASLMGSVGVQFLQRFLHF